MLRRSVTDTRGFWPENKINGAFESNLRIAVFISISFTCWRIYDRRACLTKRVWTREAGSGNVARGLAPVCSQRHMHAVDVSQESCALTASSSSLSFCHSCLSSIQFFCSAFDSYFVKEPVCGLTVFLLFQVRPGQIKGLVPGTASFLSDVTRLNIHLRPLRYVGAFVSLFTHPSNSIVPVFDSDRSVFKIWTVEHFAAIIKLVR